MIPLHDEACESGLSLLRWNGDEVLARETGALDKKLWNGGGSEIR